MVWLQILDPTIKDKALENYFKNNSSPDFEYLNQSVNLYDDITFNDLTTELGYYLMKYKSR